MGGLTKKELRTEKDLTPKTKNVCGDYGARSWSDNSSRSIKACRI